ncbi:MAG: hypothetical protein O6943_03170 [Bacteroidetes bacterium]|nr:hypothetical protein [Bacteroidota bacterium]
MYHRNRLILLFLIVFCLWSCEKQTKRTGNLFDYIPQNTENILKIADLESAKSDLAGSYLFEQLERPVFYNFLKDRKTFVSHLKPKGESVICFQKTNDSIQHFTFITKAHPLVFVVDSISNSTSEKSDYKGYQIQLSTVQDFSIFNSTIDSVFVASSSEILLKEIIDHKTESDPEFKKVFSLKTKNELVTIFQPNHLQINDSLTINFASQAALVMEVFPDGVTASGVIFDRDSIPQLISVFKGLHPKRNTIAKVIPTDALQARAVTYDDAQLLEQNLQLYHRNTAQLDPLFGSINEVASITLKEGNAVVLKSIDPEITVDEFGRFISEKGSFREIDLFNFTGEALIFKPFYPFIENISPAYAFQLDDFFIFTESEAIAQGLIASYKNSATLAKTSYFENTALQLSQASSFVVYDLQGNVSGWIAPFLTSEKSRVKKFPLAVLQLSYDRDFAHANLVCKEASPIQQSTGVISQVFNKQFDNTILGDPQFFSNHRTKGKDIVVQDVNNELYLISANGKTLWKKRLDGPILGKVQEVDILRNGKKQLAFVTRNTFYILDRNGNTVAPFPKKFKDDITQPISIFDYDRKRNYRFVITLGKEVMMYDSKGKIVTGFTFKKAGSTIVLAPQHIRIGNKDYILIAEANGKLNILSRVGKDRIIVNKKFNFSKIPIAKEGSNFVVITKENSKESISQTGKVSSKVLNVSNYWFTIRGATKVTLDDNLLRINGKLVELPFGIYTKPHIFIANRTTYITVTEIQESKVYVYSKNGKLQSGFPVYGSSLAEIASVANKILLITQASDNEITVFSFR